MNRIIKLNIIAFLVLAFSVIPTVSGQVAIDLAINPSDYTVENSVYAYSQYVSYMDEIGSSSADSSLIHDPIEVATQVVKTFSGDIWVEPNPVEAGETIVVVLDLYDDAETSVTGATAMVRLSGMEYPMTDNGDGTYSKSFETDPIEAGDYIWSIYVEKTGFEATSREFTFTVTAGDPEPEPTPSPNPITIPDSIPGMPVSTIIVGISLLVATRKRY